MENAIYDPDTSREVNGLIVRDPFPGNTIPANRLIPVPIKLQLMPAPTRAGQNNNWLQNFNGPTDINIYNTKSTIT